MGGLSTATENHVPVKKKKLNSKVKTFRLSDSLTKNKANATVYMPSPSLYHSNFAAFGGGVSLEVSFRLPFLQLQLVIGLELQLQ